MSLSTYAKCHSEKTRRIYTTLRVLVLSSQARVRISCAMLSSTVSFVSPTRKMNAGVRCCNVTRLPGTTFNAEKGVTIGYSDTVITCA
jgi:hypothetical protein